MNERKNIALELLLLNDLLRTNVIDETLYNMASQKIISAQQCFTGSNQSSVLTTA